MASLEFLKSPSDEVAVLSHSRALRQTVAGVLAGRTLHSADDANALLATVIARRTRTVIIDRECAHATTALARVNALPTRDTTSVILIVRDPIAVLPRGADLVVIEQALEAALAVTMNPAASEDRPVLLDRLLSVSLLPGTLDQALEWAADHLATGFGVDRCLISVREDSAGGAASGTRTWSSLAWSYTAERCRASAVAGTALVAPVPDNPRAPSETFLAVPLETPLGNNGFVGLIAARPRRFSADLYSALQTAAARLAAEVGWRAVYERASEELDRLSSGPGLDPLLGLWNQTAVKQLAGMQLSAAARATVPLSVAVIDVVDLQGINNRHGLDVGDRLLRRIADSVRATLREEDVVGRWAGDSIAIVLHGVGPDGALRVAERVRAALASRPIELAGSESLAIPVTVGIATPSVSPPTSPQNRRFS
jgi:diguanylate cyclase (GGDEF)-like protein